MLILLDLKYWIFLPVWELELKQTLKILSDDVLRQKLFLWYDKLVN